MAAWSLEPKTEATIIRAAPLPSNEPEVPYELTFNDKRFLKSLRIASERITE